MSGRDQGRVSIGQRRARITDGCGKVCSGLAQFPKGIEIGIACLEYLAAHIQDPQDIDAGIAMMINKETKEFAPVPQFLNIPGLVSDMQKITDSGRGKWFSNGMMALALLKNYNPWGAPPSLTLSDIMKKFDKSFRISRNSYGNISGERT